MISIEQAKQMARRLRASRELLAQELTHATALETVAHLLGYKDWNVASAMLPDENPQPAVTFDKAIPILRIFDETKAREFYFDFLGFSVEFEHRFEADLPLYLGINRNGLQLHLSEHHGDASPGSHIRINDFTGLKAYNKELIGKKYKYGRPGVEVPPWNKKSIYMTVHDPFYNKLTFNEEIL